MASYIPQEMVHDSDERYEQNPPLQDVAFLLIHTSKEGRHRGTGFLVETEGHCIVLTAAHCLYDDKAKGVANRVEIFFGRKSKPAKPSFIRELSHIYVPHTYRPTKEQDFEQDYGFIYLGKKEYFLQHEGFGLVHLNEDKMARPATIVITGYPADMAKQYQQYSVVLSNIKCHQQRRFLTYLDATAGGMSGSPLYFTSPVGHFAVGIHVNAENGAVWLTDDEISSIRQAVLRVAGGAAVRWQHHQLAEQLQTTHIGPDETQRGRQVSGVKEPKPQTSTRGACRTDMPEPSHQQKRLPLTSTGKDGKKTGTPSDIQEKQRRLQQDLGCPVYIVGDMKTGDAMLVSCLHLKYDTEKVNLEETHINDAGELVNKPDTRTGGDASGRFQNYCGTTSTVPLPLTDSPQYVEVLTEVGIDRPLEEWWDLVLDTGICRERDRDLKLYIPDRQYCYSLAVSQCARHNSVCTRVWKDRKVVHHLPDTLPNTAGSHITLHHGVVFDTAKNRIVFLDVKQMKVIGALDNVDYTQPMWPMFGLYARSMARISMKLIVGNDIDMAPEKKSMILKALQKT